MSKQFRTITDLQTALSEERVWRIREISTLKQKLLPHPVPRGPVNEEVLALLRPCVAMIYAHWEGFVKKTASTYLQFVSYQALPHDSLSPVFLAMAARKHVFDKSLTGPAADREIIQFMMEKGSVRSYLPYKNIINTRDNLKFHVFQEIFESIGISWHPYELKEKLINTKLVDKRNAIAHGQYVDIDPIDVSDLFDFISEIMGKINDQILQAAANGAYKNCDTRFT
jgi:RiboL-PSP-HEPN